MATGTFTINFGSGSIDTSVIVAEATIAAATKIEAWLFPIVTSTNFEDNYWLDDIQVIAGWRNVGVGFTVKGKCRFGKAHGSYVGFYATI